MAPAISPIPNDESQVLIASMSHRMNSGEISENGKRFFKSLYLILSLVLLGIFCKYSLIKSEKSKVESFFNYENKRNDIKTIVLLVSFDGFRPEYLRRNVTPTFLSLGNY